MKTTVYFSEDFLNRMDAYITEKKLKSRSELIEKAVDFYIDYNCNKSAGDFLASEVEAIMSGNLELVERRLGNRISKLLSEMAIQLGILLQMMKNMSEFTTEDVEMYRKITVDCIKESQRILNYEKLEE